MNREFLTIKELLGIFYFIGKFVFGRIKNNKKLSNVYGNVAIMYIVKKVFLTCFGKCATLVLGKIN